MRSLLLFILLLRGGTECFSQTVFSRKQAIEDVDFYVQTMRASHFDPSRYISLKAYNARIENIKSTIGDSISAKAFIFMMYEVTALLQDAHSTPQLGQALFRDEFKKEQFFPYKLVQDRGRLYVSKELAIHLGIPAGAEVFDINGQDMRAFFEQVQRGMAGLKPFKEDAASKLLSYFLFLKDIRPPFVLSYRNASGKAGKVTVENGAGFKNALSASLPHIIKPYDFKILDHKLGYLDVRSLSGDINSFKTFLDSCFLTFKQANVKDLAIDLRMNSGGNTDLGDLLFSYITNKKYTWGTKSWKISQVYKNYLKARDDTASSYLKEPNGSIWGNGDCIPRENRFKKDTLFEGNIYFLTGPFTFSSAMAVADVVKTYKMGTVIGEPTGENTMDFGEAFLIELPNSKIKIQSTTSLSHGADCGKTKNGPVIPDIVVKTTLEDKVLERDAVIHLLLSRI